MELVSSFTDDKAILGFAKHFCGIDLGEKDNATGNPFSLEGFCRRVLFESLMLDTQEACQLYLYLRNAIHCADVSGRSSVCAAWDFRLVRSYYSFRCSLVHDSTPRILNTELVAYLIEMLERTMKLKAMKRGALINIETLEQGQCAILYDLPIPQVTCKLGEESGISDSMDLS